MPSKAILFFVALSLFYSCQRSSIGWDKTGPEAAEQLSAHLLASPRYMLYETSFLNAIHYAEVCAAYGVVKWAETQNDTVLLRQIEERYRPLANDSLAWQDHHVDGNVYGILPLSLFRWNPEEQFKTHGLYLADAQWNDPLPNGLTRQTRYWIDDLFMVNALQTEAYQITSDPVYLDRAALFTKTYLDSLQQENGLFHHGPEAPIFWGRGNGWVAAGVAILLSTLPEGHPHYQAIADAFIRMMNGLLPYQSADGRWRQIIDLPSAWEENSCTAMFAYAMVVGINRKLLPEKKFSRAIKRAYRALVRDIDEQGRLQNICAGTGQSTDANYYLDRPRIDGDFHGQAPMLWLLSEIVKHHTN